MVVPPQDAPALASAWAALAADRSRLATSAGPRWLTRHAGERDQLDRYEALLQEVARA